jgi:hypothetical protein
VRIFQRVAFESNHLIRIGGVIRDDEHGVCGVITAIRGETDSRYRIPFNPPQLTRHGPPASESLWQSAWQQKDFMRSPNG